MLFFRGAFMITNILFLHDCLKNIGTPCVRNAGAWRTFRSDMYDILR